MNRKWHAFLTNTRNLKEEATLANQKLGPLCKYLEGKQGIIPCQRSFIRDFNKLNEWSEDVERMSSHIFVYCDDLDIQAVLA